MTTLLYGLPDPTQDSAFYRGVAVKRGLAWVFDAVLVGVIATIALPFTAFTGIFYFPALMLFLGFFYRWFTIAGGSATWGMRLMAIELRQGNGDRFDNRTAFLHTAGYTASVLLAPAQLVSAILMLVTGRGQGLTDMVLATTAINRPAPR